MNYRFILFLSLAISILSNPTFSQAEVSTDSDTTLLGLPGDNLDLFAVLDLFQKSPSIEDFEKSLNMEETGINNLDLDLDGKADFIKVVTKQEGDNFTFILQVDVNENEAQDVAVILVSKDENEKISMQMVGDKDLYGKDYAIEPAPPAPKITANPAYAGPDPVESTPASTTVVVVESAPIVHYVYSPVYVPYYPPYYYAYYPPYYAPYTVMAVSVYHHNHYHHHHGYHGGYHGNTVVVHNRNTYNNYNNSRHSSNTVNHNKASGNYNRGNSPSTRPSNGNTAPTRPSNGTTAPTKPSNGGTTSTRPSNGGSAATQPSTGGSPSTRPSNGGSTSTRPSNNSTQQAKPRSSGSSRNSEGSSRGSSGGRRR